MSVITKKGKLLQELQTTTRQDLEHLEVLKSNRPPSVGYCMGALLQQFDGTDCFQWYANTSGGTWTPYGTVFVGLDSK